MNKLLFRSFSLGRRFFNAQTKYFRGNVPWWQCEEVVTLLESFGITKHDLLSSNVLTKTTGPTIKHGVEILEECGIDVTTENICRFQDIFFSNLHDLLEKQIIKDINVHNRILRYLEPFKYNDSLRLPTIEGIANVYKPIKQYHRRSLCEKEVIDSWPNCVPEEKLCTLQVVYRKIKRQYYCWRLETDLFNIDKLTYNYSKVTGLRSIRCIRKTLDILEHQLSIPKSKIVHNFFLLSITPERLEDVINNVPKIGSTDLSTVVNQVPKILAKSSAEIQEIEQILKEYKIFNYPATFRFKLHTFNSKTIQERLHFIANSEFSAFLDHPRICELIYFFTKARQRLQEIQDRGYKCISINLLTANENLYQKFLADGVDRTHRSTDLAVYLAQTLNAPFSEIVQQINRHPLRFFIPLAEVKTTLKFLLDVGFSEKSILSEVVIVLYSRDKVEETLKMLCNNQELEKYGFNDGFVSDLKKTYSVTPKSKDRRLQLCLYFMEKPFHFTGEGALRVSRKAEEMIN